jgi:integrase
MRVAELLGLRWLDLDMKQGELSVNQIVRSEVNIDMNAGAKTKEKRLSSR